MKITQVKKLWSYDLEQSYRDMMGKEPNWETKKFFEKLCDEGVYENEDEKEKSRLRITFPFFLIGIILMLCLGVIKWILTGNRYFNSKAPYIKFMVKWDKYCRFNILS